MVSRGTGRRIGHRLLVGALGLALVLAGGATAYALTSYPAGEPHRGSLALRGGTVLAGPDLHPLEGATVLVTDGVITAVGPDTEVQLPAGTEEVDVTGHTVLPGLVDLHVHLGSPELAAGEQLAWWRWPHLVADSLRFVPGTRRALLESGVTSVRSLGDDHAWVIEMRSLLRDGELEGDRKSTRLNSSHANKSYAVFCLKKNTAPREHGQVGRRPGLGQPSGRRLRRS